MTPSRGYGAVAMVAKRTIWGVTKRTVRKVHSAHVRFSRVPSHFLTSVATSSGTGGVSSSPDEVGSLPSSKESEGKKAR